MTFITIIETFQTVLNMEEWYKNPSQLFRDFGNPQSLPHVNIYIYIYGIAITYNHDSFNTNYVIRLTFVDCKIIM